MQKMIGKMSRMYPIVILMGLMIVIIAFIVGFSNSQAAAAYFAGSKSVRETTLMAQRAAIESTNLWLPYFKFLGIGLILGGIVMALRVILDSLKQVGMDVLSNLPAEKRPVLPQAPWYGLMMPIVMMVGLLIFIVAFIVSLQLAAIANTVFANPIPAIDAAGAGSVLLSQVNTIHSVLAWLVPLKFFGIATLFLAITMGLATIATTLKAQTVLLQQGVKIARGAAVQEHQHDHQHGHEHVEELEVVSAGA